LVFHFCNTFATYFVANIRKKRLLLLLNNAADTIRLFISEIGSKPNRDWTIEYEGDLKENFMKELNKESKKNPAVPSEEEYCGVDRA
jgi:hypothetical protein